jgi:hypothetical protein
MIVPAITFEDSPANGTGQSQIYRAAARNLQFCELVTFAVAWSLADLAALTQPGLDESQDCMGFR